MFMKSNKGITLIALVVTIIVLMILAGIAVAALMGDNGIIKRAGEAKESQRGATVQDEVTLALSENKMTDEINKTKGVTGGLKTKETLVNELVDKGYLTNDEATELETEDEITIGNVRIDFSQLGVDIASQYAPYDNPYIPTNFSHVGTEDWNHGFTIKGDVGTANENDEFVWVPCVTDQAKVKSGDIVQTFEKHFSSETLETDPSWQNAEHCAYAGADDAEYFSEEATSASAIRTSVETYGGFYIAKYEAGVEGTTANGNLSTKIATDGSVKPLSQAEKGVWNYITRTNAITVSEAMIPSTTGCKSALISGACWDTTMQWIKQTTNTNYDVNSTGKGNYNENENTNSWKSSVTTTASSTNYKVNGIYDMAGNVWELTTENDIHGNWIAQVCRGGIYWFSGSTYPAATRQNFYTEAPDDSLGFRVVLYK